MICSRMIAVDGVDPLLHQPEQRAHLDDDHDPILTASVGTTITIRVDSVTSCRSAKMMPPTHMIGAAIMKRERHEHQHLDLLDVVGRASDQRRGAELGDLARRERLDLAEDRARRSRPSAIAVRAPK